MSTDGLRQPLSGGGINWGHRRFGGDLLFYKSICWDANVVGTRPPFNLIRALRNASVSAEGRAVILL